MTWLMIQSPGNLNRASTWVSIANKHFSPLYLYSDFPLCNFTFLTYIYGVKLSLRMMEFMQFPHRWVQDGYKYKYFCEMKIEAALLFYRWAKHLILQ